MRQITGVAAVAAICASAGMAAIAAQEAMGKSMNAPASRTYTGSVGAGLAPGTFTLTHATEVAQADDARRRPPHAPASACATGPAIALATRWTSSSASDDTTNTACPDPSNAAT